MLINIYAKRNTEYLYFLYNNKIIRILYDNYFHIKYHIKEENFKTNII